MTIAPVPVDEAVPGPRPELPDDSLVALYREMVRVRAFEEEVIDAFGKGLIPGSTHPCIGAEAIKAGALSPLAADDLVFATYRGHGEALIKGVEPVSMMAELMGRATGVCKGKGGSMHLSEPSVGLVSTNAIVAGHIPMAGGAALSCQFRGSGQVVLCFFGDGASCEGEFFEAMNMAMLWKVPLVFICENNGIAISVPTAKSQATPDIADRARGFGMPASIVDGNDVVAVRAAVAEGVARARSGEARRSWSARPSAGSGTPRSPPGEAIRRSSGAPGSGSTRSRVSGRRLSPGASRRTPTSTMSTCGRAPRCARSETRRSALPSRRPTPSTRTSLRPNAGRPRPAPRAQP